MRKSAKRQCSPPPGQPLLPIRSGVKSVPEDTVDRAVTASRGAGTIGGRLIYHDISIIIADLVYFSAF